jgi:hypothetical protein
MMLDVLTISLGSLYFAISILLIIGLTTSSLPESEETQIHVSLTLFIVTGLVLMMNYFY